VPEVNSEIAIAIVRIALDLSDEAREVLSCVLQLMHQSGPCDRMCLLLIIDALSVPPNTRNKPTREAGFGLNELLGATRRPLP
jgi:hypothetical protein